MSIEIARNHDRIDPTTRSGSRLMLPLLLAGLVTLGCSGDELVFIPSPVAGDPRAAIVTLVQCDCDRCRVAVDNPETGDLSFNRVDPPPGQPFEAAACYDKGMIRLIVECGGCPLPGPCSVRATLALEGEDGGVPDSKLQSPEAACTTAVSPAAFCNSSQVYDLSPITLVNPVCPM